jgi:hypothetical protein
MTKRRGLGRRAGTWGMAVAIWEIWKYIPKKHRRRVLLRVSKHGSTLVTRAFIARRNTRR